MSTSPPHGPSDDARGTLLLVSAAALWSINGLLIKWLYDGGMSGLSIAGIRSLVAAVFLLPFALRRWRPIAEPGWTAATVLMFTGMCATFVVATTLTTAANAIILQYTAPAWVFLLSPWIVRERAEPAQWLAFAVSMAAVALIFGAQYTADSVGLLVGIASGVVFGTQVVFFRRVRDLDPVVLAFLSCAGSALLLTPIALAVSGWQVTLHTGLLVTLAGVVQFGLPYVLYAAGVRHASAQRAVLIIMLEPVLNPIWVFLVIGERPHWSTIIGGGLIVLSVGFLAMKRSRPVARVTGGE